MMSCSVAILMCTFAIVTGVSDFRICVGDYPQYYNTKTQVCKSGIIRNITTKRPLVTTVKPTRPQKYSPVPKPPPEPATDVLHCAALSLQYGKSKGLQCCGDSKTYNPRFDTCCQTNLKAAEVHRNKKERKHACCRNNIHVVYKRGSREMPCIHPSLNDKVFRGKRKLNVLRKNCKDFKDYEFAYIVRIHKKTNLHSTEYYNATISKLPWKSQAENESSFNKLIPIDKYSPKVRRIQKKAFVVLSNCDQSKHLDFYLDRSPDKEDVVFRGSKVTKKFPKRFNKLWRKCRQKITRPMS